MKNEKIEKKEKIEKQIKLNRPPRPRFCFFFTKFIISFLTLFNIYVVFLGEHHLIVLFSCFGVAHSEYIKIS
jgi:hypothetical protein